MNPDIFFLEKNLDYTFKDKKLLDQALRHSSFVNEQPDSDPLENNERLEFLGDSVLSMVISHLLMERFPMLQEGDLSKIRSGLVNEFQLSEMAAKLGLGRFIHLGHGEMLSGGHQKSSILADTLEAVLAAVYLDGGFETVFHIIRIHFLPLFKGPAVPKKNQDFKSQIQELAQAKYKEAPKYQVINESGPDHDKIFEVELRVGEIITHGYGKSKKTAEQAAAKASWQLLNDVEK